MHEKAFIQIIEMINLYGSSESEKIIMVIKKTEKNNDMLIKGAKYENNEKIKQLTHVLSVNV